MGAESFGCKSLKCRCRFISNPVGSFVNWFPWQFNEIVLINFLIICTYCYAHCTYLLYMHSSLFWILLLVVHALGLKPCITLASWVTSAPSPPWSLTPAPLSCMQGSQLQGMRQRQPSSAAGSEVVYSAVNGRLLQQQIGGDPFVWCEVGVSLFRYMPGRMSFQTHTHCNSRFNYLRLVMVGDYNLLYWWWMLVSIWSFCSKDNGTNFLKVNIVIYSVGGSS